MIGIILTALFVIGLVYYVGWFFYVGFRLIFKAGKNGRLPWL